MEYKPWKLCVEHGGDIRVVNERGDNHWANGVDDDLEAIRTYDLSGSTIRATNGGVGAVRSNRVDQRVASVEERDVGAVGALLRVSCHKYEALFDHPG